MDAAARPRLCFLVHYVKRMATDGLERSNGDSVRGELHPQHKLPRLTHLQFLVLDILVQESDGLSATQLRKMLEHYGESRQGPKFYQLMRRLEIEQQFRSRSRVFDVGGGQVRRTYYYATERGIAVVAQETFWTSTRLGFASQSELLSRRPHPTDGRLRKPFKPLRQPISLIMLMALCRSRLA